MPLFEFNAFLTVEAETPEEAEFIATMMGVNDPRVTVSIDDSPPTELEEDEGD